ncbi:hypothetical protein [Desulfobacter latus]|uniref:Uncharacterized protein n=1 Tax=Desulfobacter latus TaxID=2292 RepID=A0A850T2Y9_9BACT|nr:hypothetical protein [Desulfobacter latus]NWH06103.1 hypothetical protein [Desulfobacter latus]
MGFFDMFDKLDDIIYKPIETVCDWLKAPLRSMDDNRAGKIEREKIKLEASIDKADKEFNAKLEAASKKLDAEIAIKKETEVVKIIAEIEQWKQDKDFARKKAVSDAIIEYQRELTKLNVNAINAIGHMQLDLRERVQNMIIDKTKQYKTLQNEAKQEAINEYKIIMKEFANEPEIKQNMIKQVDESVAIIIHNSKAFITELTEDLRSVNKSIDLLALNGQKFIETHLQQFHSLGFSQEQLKQLENGNSFINTIDI